MPEHVRIGGLGRRELLAALRGKEIQLNELAEGLFEDDRFITSVEERLVQVESISVAELGFDEGAVYAQLVARALERGLSECPLELGPQLRLQASEQPDGADGGPMSKGRAPRGSVTVASSPLDEDDGTAKGFYLRRVGDVSWLRGYRSWAAHVWSPEDVLVFVVSAASDSASVVPRPDASSG